MQGIVRKSILKQMQRTGHLIFLILVCLNGLSAQYLSGFSTRYDNDLSEWIVYPESKDDQECEIRCRWKYQQDPSEWDFRMGEISGTIRSKWKDKLDEWEVISENQITRIRMVWPRDPREWRVESGGKEYTIKMIYNNPGSDWIVEEDNKIIFKCFTAFQSDIRDWIVEDDLPENAHLNARIGLVFAVIISNMMN